MCNGNAIADVVAVYKTLHCYEIKGETDNVSRIVRQSEYYDQAFCLVSLVTTKNHLDRALALAPAHWGIILASASDSVEVRFRHIRGASKNPSYSPEIALLTLWRSELIEFPLAEGVIAGKMNRQKIAEAIASNSPTKFINERLGHMLATRRDRLTTKDNLAPCM